MANKKKILIVNEFSQLATGFATYMYYVLPRLFETGKYKIAEMACIPNPYAMINMASGGYKPISNIQINDEVITHTGKSQKVTNTMCREYDGNVITLNREIFRVTPIKATEGHPILCIKKANAYKYNFKISKEFNPNPTAEWINIEDISCGDFVAYTPPINNNPSINKLTINNLSIDCSNDFALFAGWFLAEGCIHHDTVLGNNAFSFCGNLTKEKELVEYIAKFISKEFNISYTTYTNSEQNKIESKFSSKYLTSIFYSLFGIGSRGKFVHQQFYQCSKEFISRLLAAYFEGDGTVCENGIAVRTESEHLAIGITQLCYQIGIVASLRTNKRSSFEIHIYGEQANQISQFFKNKKTNFKPLTRTEYLVKNGSIFFRVHQIHKENFKGKVYNFSVENDESYICENHTVHNCYINKYHPLIDEVPWKVYPVEPDPHNPQEIERHRNNRAAQFGANKFEETLLEFKPDIVISIRDPFFDDFIDKSPFRKHFKWLHMTTCDGQPQKPEWLDMFSRVDKLLTYSYWAKHVLETESGGRLVVRGVASPGTDLTDFKPIPKDEAKTAFGMVKDCIVFGTVMRNQPRKLFPELMKVFVRYLEICKENGRLDLATKSFLYFHTGINDVGWSFPDELKRYHLGHKVLFTYFCDKCRSVYPAFYHNDAHICRVCQRSHARTPNTANGISRTELARVMNTFDLYVQYSVCEGWGMAGNDAKACGIPTLQVDYSAMIEQTHAGGGFNVDVDRMFQESIHQTGQWRAMPNNETAAQLLYQFAIASQEQKDRWSKDARECVEKYYTWDRVASIWESIIDATDVPQMTQTWLSKANYIQPNLGIPPNLNNEAFAEWCYTNVLRKPEYIGTHHYNALVNILNDGYETILDGQGQPHRQPVNRENIVNHMINQVNQLNHAEHLRYLKCVEPQKLEKPEMIPIEV